MRLLHLVRNDKFILLLLLYVIISYFTLRLADPYIFHNANFFDPRPNTLFVQNLESLKSFEGKDIWYPPAVQWMSKNATFPLINLAMFGLGLPYFMLVIFGLLFVILNEVKDLGPMLHRTAKLRFARFLANARNDRANRVLLIMFLWVLAFFTYQSFQFVKAMRYFIFIYPFLAIFAGIGVSLLINVIARSEMTRQSHCFVSRLLRFARNDRVSSLVIIAILLIWPVAFTSIYTNKNSRVVASEWMYKNLPNESVILSEHWDDGLPLPLEENYGKQFLSEQLPVFDPDTEEKWNKMNELLGQANYYVLSSNRGWGSIPTVPEKYPKMSKFYTNLLAGDCHPESRNPPSLKLRWASKFGTSFISGSVCYKKIAEFISYPKLEIGNWKLEISDEVADESFTVYDHPKVLIFERL